MKKNWTVSFLWTLSVLFVWFLPQPSFAEPAGPAAATNDNPGGEDLLVRDAAVRALGKLSGTLIAVDAHTGRILSLVNPELALQNGYQPCSTFKPAVALAALQEGLIEPDRNRLRLGKSYMSLPESLARSNNYYFAELGIRLGLEKMAEYASRFGFGNQRAGLNIAEESGGLFPAKAPPKSQGGVGKVASFGQGISMTLLQLVSFTSALANGGTLYYLQYPQTPEAVFNFQPLIKRRLNIAEWLEPVREGMEKAVLSGTARNARQPDLPIFGKTGTCRENGTSLAWFTSYTPEQPSLAVAVLLRTRRHIGGGARAAKVAGTFFRRLADQGYFARTSQPAEARGSRSNAARVFIMR